MLTPADLTQDQLDCIEWAYEGDDSLICADVGTGKTVISSTVMARALVDERVSRWLVVAPKLVALDTWGTEFSKWAHLHNIDIRIAVGGALARRDIMKSNAQIVVINYENLVWLLDEYQRPRRGKPDPLPFDGLVCDEIDKLKTVSSSRFKELRYRLGAFKMRIGLTGTLLPNDLTEVWGQTFVIDKGVTFGTSFYKWRQKHFYPTDYQQHDWAAFPDTRRAILKALEGVAYRLKGVDLPDVVYEPPTLLDMPEPLRDVYRELEREMYLKIDEHEIDPDNQAVLKGKLMQICAGFSYVDPIACAECGGAVSLRKKTRFVCNSCGCTAPKLAYWHSRAKFDWLRDLVKTLGPKRQLLVFYHFQEELEELIRLYPRIGLIKGVSAKKARSTINAWNEGTLRLLALHPASAGHGLNLQHSGAHDIAFLTWPWSGGMLKQVTGRLARRGATVRQVFVHSGAFKGTVDEDVHTRARGKESALLDFLNEMENVL